MGRHPKDFQTRQAFPFLVGAILLIVAFFVGMEFGNRKTFKEQTPAKVSPQSEAKAKYSIGREIIEDSGATYSIKIIYPKIIGEGDSIARANLALKEKAEEAKKTFLEDAKGTEKFAIVSEEKSELSIDFEILKFNENFASFKYNVSEYQAGSAHPSGYVATINVDLAQGRELKLSEIFSGKWLEAVSAFCRKSLLAQNEGAAQDAKDWIKEGTNPASENFSAIGFRGTSAIIYFNPYQVAPYAQGISEVDMPLELLGAYMDTKTRKLVGSN